MTRNNLEPLSVLLVEDSPADVFLVREAMRQEGLSFRLEVADDGETAIQMLDRVDAEFACEPPHLALLDVNLPRRDGTQVLERLRRSPRCGSIPVVMISSSNSPTERKHALDLGATEYFLKPSKWDELMLLGKLVRQLLDNHE